MWLSVGARPRPVKRPDVSGTALSRRGLATDYGALTASAYRVPDGVIRDRSRGRFGVLRMDIGALASAFVGAKIAEAQMAVAARMLRINADAAASVVRVIDAAQQNMDRLANVAAGIGGNPDVTA